MVQGKGQDVSPYCHEGTYRQGEPYDAAVSYTHLDMDYTTVSRNLQRYIRTNKFAPTIAELRNEMPKGFSNFAGRNYDMKKLELALLGVRPAAGIEEIKEGRTESD